MLVVFQDTGSEDIAYVSTMMYTQDLLCYSVFGILINLSLEAQFPGDYSAATLFPKALV